MFLDLEVNLEVKQLKSLKSEKIYLNKTDKYKFKRRQVKKKIKLKLNFQRRNDNGEISDHLFKAFVIFLNFSKFYDFDLL